MRGYISDELRRLVAARAEYLCEYCLLHEEDTYFGCQIDHIISVKHGGATDADNLAYACPFCNRHKGSEIGSIVRETNEYVRFFNPRLDKWAEHFRLNGAVIEPLTSIGEVTARILGFNDAEQVLERRALIETGSYPSEPARQRMMK